MGLGTTRTAGHENARTSLQLVQLTTKKTALGREQAPVCLCTGTAASVGRGVLSRLQAGMLQITLWTILYTHVLSARQANNHTNTAILHEKLKSGSASESVRAIHYVFYENIVAQSAEKVGWRRHALMNASVISNSGCVPPDCQCSSTKSDNLSTSQQAVASPPAIEYTAQHMCPAPAFLKPNALAQVRHMSHRVRQKLLHMRAAHQPQFPLQTPADESVSRPCIHIHRSLQLTSCSR